MYLLFLHVSLGVGDVCPELIEKFQNYVFLRNELWKNNNFLRKKIIHKQLLSLSLLYFAKGPSFWGAGKD